MKRLSLIFSCILLCCCYGFSQQRITIQGNQFMHNNEPFFLIGANTPWDNWNDFGGEYDPEFWEQEFARMEQKGINSSRIWISCDAAGQPYVDSSGITHPASQQFWDNMDDMMQKAQKHNIYIIATIASFDKLDNTKPGSANWLSMIMCQRTLALYAETFLKPLVKRYESNPYFFAIDICNEPEWMNEHKKYGGLEWEYLQSFVGMCAAAIHSCHTPVLVTVGSAAVKWSCDKFEGNKWSDQALQDITADTLAYLDFWQIHYYDWTNQFGNPFHNAPAFYGLEDKPCIIGETPGNNTKYGFEISYEEIYSLPYQLGYSGVYPWTSNGAGSGDFGSLDTFGEGASQIAKKIKQK